MSNKDKKRAYEHQSAHVFNDLKKRYTTQTEYPKPVNEWRRQCRDIGGKDPICDITRIYRTFGYKQAMWCVHNVRQLRPKTKMFTF